MPDAEKAAFVPRGRPKRKNKLNQKKQHVVVLKEIRLRPKIDDHDRDIKVNHAIKFLEKGVNTILQNGDIVTLLLATAGG